MNSVRRLSLITLLTIVGSLVIFTTDARSYHDDNINTPRHRHRHRHEVSSLTTRRNHESYKIATREPTWNQNNDEDYVDDTFDVNEDDKKKDEIDGGGGGDDDEGDEDDSEDEDEKSYYRLPINYPSRYEIRYRDMRYHVNPTRHAINPWQNIGDVEQQQRRRNLRFKTRGHRTRPWIYPSRNHDSLDDEDENDDKNVRDGDDDIEDYDEYERSRWHHLINDEDYDESLNRRNFPSHRRSDYSHNSYRGWNELRRDIVAGKLRKTDQDMRKKFGNNRHDGRKRGSNYFYNHRVVDKNEDKNNSVKWSKYKMKKSNDTITDYDGDIDDDEEENIWEEAELDDEEDDDVGNDNVDENDNEMDDNNLFHDTEPPYKTFDDIIKSLTSDDPTTLKPPSVKRDYRNIEIEKYLKRDAYGNLKYEPKKIQKSILSIRKDPKIINTKYFNSMNGKQKLSNGITTVDNRKIVESKLNNVRIPVVEKKKMSLVRQVNDDDDGDDDDDEDEYLNSDDKHSDIQSDVTNGYAVDEINENETSATVTRGTTTPITSTTSTSISTSTTTTTSTSRPVITTTQHNYDRKDSRPYNGTNGTPLHNNNGVQSAYNSQKGQIKSPSGQSIKNAAEIREAIQHAIKVSHEGSCQWPRARVIPVRDVYPSPSTSYIPHCAILHRCSDDTGCCRSETLTCVPKQTHKVELYFYTTSIGGSSVVEKLSFYNHTECECREKSEYRMTTMRTTSDNKLFSVQDTNEYKSYSGRQQHQSAVPPQNIRRQPQKKLCRCPSEFTPRMIIGGECQCNCFENDQDCIRMRRGKGFFSLRDRQCIQNNECAMPACEFGEYIKRQGKCPRKIDRYEKIARNPSNMNHNLRYRS